MRLIWMRPSGRPVWPFSEAANLSASRCAERSTAALLTAGSAAAPPCVPGRASDDAELALARVCCHESNVS